MTAWYDGVPLHTIKPTQMLNSIEWKASQWEEEDYSRASESMDENCKHHVSLVADEDSMYVRLNDSALQRIKKLCGNISENQQNQEQLNTNNTTVKQKYIWHTLQSIVCKDISQKMYEMNDTLNKAFKIHAMKHADQNSRKNPLFRSLSLDVLDTASNGKLVTENWLACQGRALPLMCLHDLRTNLSKSKYSLARQKVPICTREEEEILDSVKCRPWKDTDVAYMLLNSNHVLQRPLDNDVAISNEYGFNGEKLIIPSLRIQMKKINKKSCKFVLTENDMKWDLDNSLNHCGFCSFCKPSPEGEGVAQT